MNQVTGDLVQGPKMAEVKFPSEGQVIIASLVDNNSICLFGVLRRFQHCTGHITTGSWKGRGNQYI